MQSPLLSSFHPSIISRTVRVPHCLSFVSQLPSRLTIPIRLARRGPSVQSGSILYSCSTSRNALSASKPSLDKNGRGMRTIATRATTTSPSTATRTTTSAAATPQMTTPVKASAQDLSRKEWMVIIPDHEGVLEKRFEVRKYVELIHHLFCPLPPFPFLDYPISPTIPFLPPSV